MTDMTQRAEPNAVLNVTWHRQNGSLPDPVFADLTKEEALHMATEAVRTGSIPGIDADPDVDLEGFEIDRIPAHPAMFCTDCGRQHTMGTTSCVQCSAAVVERMVPHKLMLRPKTPVGIQFSATMEKLGKSAEYINKAADKLVEIEDIVAHMEGAIDEVEALAEELEPFHEAVTEDDGDLAGALKKVFELWGCKVSEANGIWNITTEDGAEWDMTVPKEKE